MVEQKKTKERYIRDAPQICESGEIGSDGE
jgi:hypothetical protein